MKCTCIGCKLKAALSEANKDIGFGPRMVVVSMAKKPESDDAVIPTSTVDLIAKRDIFAGETVVVGKDVRLPTPEEAINNAVAAASLQKQIDDIWCAMMETDTRPTDLDRKTDAWQHAKNLHGKGVNIGN